MPVTYSLIASNTLSSSAASVTFSAIPNTFTDLVLRMSTRTNFASPSSDLRLRLNNDASALYSYTLLRGSGSAASSLRASGVTYLSDLQGNANSATSNTFGVTEIYIPSYTASQNKTFSVDNAQEDNSSTAYREAAAALYRSNSAISQIDVFSFASASFLSGSSFFLYGIKNS